MARASTLLLALLALAAATAAVGRHKKGPWFCRGRSCPRFKTLEDEGDYVLRRYCRSTWAVSCACSEEHMPEGLLRARARVLEYVKDNGLWGATPFVTFVRWSWQAQAALLNATALHAPAFDAAASEAAAGALAWGHLHQTVCFAYYLPDKFQSAAGPVLPGAADELGRRPPRPRRDSGVKVLRLRRGFEAFAAGFGGFATPPRFIYESMRLAHFLRWHHEDAAWGTAMLFEYDGPARVKNRWNEVLIPARSWHQQLLEEGEDVFAGEGEGEGEGEAAVAEA